MERKKFVCSFTLLITFVHENTRTNRTCIAEIMILMLLAHLVPGCFYF